MSTFIQLCQRVRQESGIAGQGQPTTVVGQVGIMGKIVDRVSRAWIDIQTKRGGLWKFNQAELVFQLTKNKQFYSRADLGLNTIQKWNINSLWIYQNDGSDESRLRWQDYNRFRQKHRIYPPGRPMEVTEGVGINWTLPFAGVGTTPLAVGDVITGSTSTATATILTITITSGSWAGGNAVGTLSLANVTANALLNGTSQTGSFKNAETIVGSPSGGRATCTANAIGTPTDAWNLLFDMTPDLAYVISLDFWQTPEVLTNDNDVPRMPEQFHDVILWKAVMSYAGSETASELYTYAKTMHDAIYFDLVIDQGMLPPAVGAYPMARGMRPLRGFGIWSGSTF